MTIGIRTSRLLRVALLLVWAAGVALLATRSPLWGWGGMLLWSTAILFWARVTYGLNGRDLALQYVEQVPHVVVDGVAEPLTGIRPGLITPVLATALLSTPRGRYAIMATTDNVARDAHWRLRRLLADHKGLDPTAAHLPTR